MANHPAIVEKNQNEDFIWENGCEDFVKNGCERLRIIDNKIVVLKDNSKPSSIILNRKIEKLPSQYFEVKIIVTGTHPLDFSIGLAKKGISFDNWPGYKHGATDAIVYIVFDHAVWSKNKEWNIIEDAPNDISVVGCGLDRDGLCYFTIDGMRLKNTYRIDKCVSHPIITMEDKGLVLEINLGETDFLYKSGNDSKLNSNYGPTFSDQWIHQIKRMKGEENNNMFHNLNDVTITSKDGQRIGCHRLILSVRSKVFRAMFEHEQLSRKEIDLPDFDGDTIRLMLDFIYGDLENKIEESVDFDLLAIANKYEIVGLQAYCEDILCQKLDVENVLDAWKSSKFLGSKIILDRAECFIKSNWKAIKATKTYDLLIKDDVQSMINVIVRMIGSHQDEMVQDLLHTLSGVKKIE